MVPLPQNNELRPDRLSARLKGVKLPFAIRTADGRLVDVLIVPNGKGCGCVCPACGLPLVARNNGKVLRPHFSHSADCEGAFETAVHETAKQIVREMGFVWLPKSQIADAQKFPFTQHTLEKRYDRIVPDVMVWNDEGSKLAVEMFVTHAVDSAKHSKLRQLKLSCIEFDLSGLPRDITYDALRARFEGNEVTVKWIFNRKVHRAMLIEAKRLREEAERKAAQEKQLMDQARREAIERPVIVRKNRRNYDIYHVEPCPKAARVSNSAKLANVRLDCVDCRFCFGIKGSRRAPTAVKCGGHVPADHWRKNGPDDWRFISATM